MPIADEMRVNRNRLYVGTGPLRARPSGFHAGTIAVALADGSTRLISDDIEYHVYQALMAPHDKLSDIPDLNFVFKEDDIQ